MEARPGGGGVTASVNMWALLADNDPGDSQEAAKRDMQTVAVPNGEVITVSGGKLQSGSGGDQKRKKRKKKTKQAKAPESAAVGNGGEVAVGDQKRNDKKARATAVSNGNVSNGAAHVQSSHGPSKGRNKEPNKQQEAVRGGSCGRALFVAAATTALLAFSFHVSVSAAPAV